MTEEDSTAWAEHVGPCYTVTGMARRLGWTETDVLEGGNDLTLLMLPTDDDIYLLPVLQFKDGKVFDRLDEMLMIFQTMTDDCWMWACWMTAALPEDPSPEEIERIRDVSREVPRHGLRRNWWWITPAESTDVEDRDG